MAAPRAFSRLTSRQHALVSACRDLARGRGESGAVLLDGAHVIAEALASDVPIDAAIVSADLLADDGPHGRRLVEALHRHGTTVYEGTDDVIAAASPVRTPAGLVAIARWSPATIAATLAPPPSLTIGLVGVQDPGNLGAAIRSADALGATGVIGIDDAANPSGWKAIRGSMGSTFHLPVARAGFADVVAHARSTGVQIVAAVARSGRAPESVPFTNQTIILLGSEGAGLGDDYLPTDAIPVTLAMRHGVESLNVAVAAALLLYEAARQRAAGRHS